jgi:hypothetical protein
MNKVRIGLVLIVLLLPLKLQDTLTDLGPCLLGPACTKEAA